MELRYDIVLPTYGQPKLIEECFFSIAEHSQNFRLIWIDNGRDGQRFDWSEWGSAGNLVVQPGSNIGYTKAINAGLALSTAPFVVLMNSDTTVVTDDWLWSMESCFSNVQQGRVAAVTPSCDNPAQGLAGQLPKNTGFHLVHPHPIDHGWGYDVKLSFWCIMLQREAILDVGYLDERFSPGCGEDDDWLLRAHLKGWAMGVQTDALVTHTHPHASWDAEHRAKCAARASAYLKEKYAEIIAEEIKKHQNATRGIGFA